MSKFMMFVAAGLAVALAPAADAKPKAHGGAHVVKPLAAYHGRAIIDRNRNGIWDRDEALARRYGGTLCPPGLAKKPVSCVPPGQTKRAFRVGQRVTRNYRYYIPYSSIPLVLREQYDLSTDYRYVYRNNVIYVVDPTTLLVTRIINAIL